MDSRNSGTKPWASSVCRVLLRPGFQVFSGSGCRVLTGFQRQQKGAFSCVPACVPGPCVPIRKPWFRWNLARNHGLCNHPKTPDSVETFLETSAWKHPAQKCSFAVTATVTWATARAECVRLPPFMESKNSVRARWSCGRSFGGAAPAPWCAVWGLSWLQKSSGSKSPWLLRSCGAAARHASCDGLSGAGGGRTAARFLVT